MVIRDLKIVLLGPTGSGKSTLFHTFVLGISELGRKNRFVVTWNNHPLVNLPPDQLPPPNVKLDDPIVGTMAGFGQIFQLLVTDPPGRDLFSLNNEEVVKRTSDCDLLVLVVDPHTLLDGVAQQSVRQAMVQHVQKLHKTRAATGGYSPVIAVAFTKADEYALNGSPCLRCIETEHQREKLKEWVEAYRNHVGDINQSWHALIDALCPANDSFGVMRRQILNNSRLFFEQIICGALTDDKYFNAYIVTSKPGDPHIKPFPWDRRGVNEIFDDFFRIVNEDQTEPVISTKATMLSLAGSLILLLSATTACLFLYHDDSSAGAAGLNAMHQAGWVTAGIAVAGGLGVALVALLTRAATKMK